VRTKRGLSLTKKISAKGTTTKEDLSMPSLEEGSINATIRANVNYLLDQLVLDIAEAKLEKEFGSEWLSTALVGSSPQKWLEEVDKYRFHLEQTAAEVTEAAGWNFQRNKIDELPRPTASWLSKKSGLTVGQINQLIYRQNEDGTFGGKSFTVTELIVLANALNTTIQFLLTPPLKSILLDYPVSYYKGRRRSALKTSISQWHLWIHSLAPLPEQNFYLYEKHASHFVGYQEEKKSRNAKPGIHPTAMSAADIQHGPLSSFSRLNNYSPEAKASLVGPTTPIPKGASHKSAEIEILGANLGFFVEIRKLLRSSNLSRPNAEIEKIFESGVSKAKSQLGQIVRFLRFTQID
jgi:hypothetical protein